MEFSMDQIIQFLKTDIYPFWTSVPDKNDYPISVPHFLPREEFKKRGASDPKTYYESLISA